MKTKKEDFGILYPSFEKFFTYTDINDIKEGAIIGEMLENEDRKIGVTHLIKIYEVTSVLNSAKFDKKYFEVDYIGLIRKATFYKYKYFRKFLWFWLPYQEQKYDTTEVVGFLEEFKPGNPEIITGKSNLFVVQCYEELKKHPFLCADHYTVGSPFYL